MFYSFATYGVIKKVATKTTHLHVATTENSTYFYTEKHIRCLQNNGNCSSFLKQIPVDKTINYCYFHSCMTGNTSGYGNPAWVTSHCENHCENRLCHLSLRIEWCWSGREISIRYRKPSKKRQSHFTIQSHFKDSRL